MPIMLALMFNEILNQSFKKTAQTIVYLPHFISSVIIAGIVITAFSPSAGIVNTILGWFGIEPIYFLTKPEWFRPIFVGTGIWQEAGFQSIVYLAAIAGVSPTLYESAVVDGASRWQMMWKITVPSIMPTIIIMLIIRIGNMLEVSFEMIILLYQPATYRDGGRGEHLHLSPGHPGRPIRPCRRSGPVQRGRGLCPGDDRQHDLQALFAHVAVVREEDHDQHESLFARRQDLRHRQHGPDRRCSRSRRSIRSSTSRRCR